MFPGLKFRNRVAPGVEADVVNRGAAIGTWARIKAVLGAGPQSQNVGVALQPYGTGAIAAQVPDGTTAGGNARGANSVDFQTLRALGNQVASAQGAVIAGGQNNVASASWSAVVGGQGNTAAGGGWAVVGGRDNNCSAVFGTAFGFGNTVTGVVATVSGGASNTGSGSYSWCPGGYQATVRDLWGAYAWSSGQRAALGDTQHFGQVTSRTTADTTATDLTGNRSAAGSTNIMVLPNNCACSGLWLIQARDSAGNAATWIKAFRATRGANAASTAVAFSTDMMTANIDAALSTVTVAIVADTANGGPKVQVTGVAATTIDWIAEPFALQIVR